MPTKTVRPATHPGRELGKDRLLRGEGRYVADLKVPGRLEMAVLRSPHASAEILAIDTRAARALPGVRLVLTADDLRARFPGTLRSEAPALAPSIVHYLGEPVACVVVEGDRAEAEDATEAISITYRPLPAQTDPLRDTRVPTVRADTGSDLAYDDVVGYGDVDRALRDAEVTVTFRQRWGRGTAHPLETRGMLALPGPLGQLTIYAADQAPHALRRQLSQALGIPEERIRAVAPDVGGGFGVKNGGYPEDLLCAAAALLTGRPVRYIEDRREHFLATVQERDQVQTVTVAARRDGTLLAIDAEAIADHGAYAFRFPIVGHTAVSAPATYRLPNYRIHVQSVYTHKAPQGPYRGAGRPQGNWLAERAMDHLARALDMDPAEIRRRNLRQPEDFPLTLQLQGRRGTRPVVLDSADLPALLEATLHQARYEELRKQQAWARANGAFSGIGIAASLEDTGTGPYEGARTSLGPDGRIRVTAGTPSQGQGHETVFAELTARALGIAPERVEVTYTDTDLLPRGIGTFGSRTASTGAVAVHRSAEALATRLRRIAGLLLEAAPEDIELGDGRATVRGVPARALALEDIARRMTQVIPGPNPVLSAGGGPDLSETVYVPVERSVYGASVHVVSLTVDPDDYRVRFGTYVIGYDVGTRMHPAIVEGQIVGGLSHGLSSALYEELVYDAQGQLLTQSFLDYLLPTASDMPNPVLTFRETPTPWTELGAKGVGESGTIPSPAAIMAALEDALGVDPQKIPLSPSDLFALDRNR